MCKFIINSTFPNFQKCDWPLFLQDSDTGQVHLFLVTCTQTQWSSATM